MNTTIPVDLLALKSRVDQWRATRKHIRERMPEDLRQAVVESCRRHSPALIRRALKIDPWRLTGSMTTTDAPTRENQAASFFEFPTDAVLPISMAAHPSNFRLQLERPDGSRLTLTSPDLVSARQICSDFLNKQ